MCPCPDNTGQARRDAKRKVNFMISLPKICVCPYVTMLSISQSQQTRFKRIKWFSKIVLCVCVQYNNFLNKFSFWTFAWTLFWCGAQGMCQWFIIWNGQMKWKINVISKSFCLWKFYFVIKRKIKGNIKVKLKVKVSEQIKFKLGRKMFCFIVTGNRKCIICIFFFSG